MLLKQPQQKYSWLKWGERKCPTQGVWELNKKQPASTKIFQVSCFSLNSCKLCIPVSNRSRTVLVWKCLKMSKIEVSTKPLYGLWLWVSTAYNPSRVWEPQRILTIMALAFSSIKWEYDPRQHPGNKTTCKTITGHHSNTAYKHWIRTLEMNYNVPLKLHWSIRLLLREYLFCARDWTSSFTLCS